METPIETEKKELTVDEILKAFAEYPLAPIAIFDSTDGSEPVQDILEGIDFVSKQVIAERTNFDPRIIKLILKDVKRMSDEDALQVAKIFLGESPQVRALDGRLIAQSLYDNETAFTPAEHHALMNTLKSLNYGIKPPFGKGHWAVDGSYFSLGLAIQPKSE